MNRLAGLAVLLHCLLPESWVPPLQPPTAMDLLPGKPQEVSCSSTTASQLSALLAEDERQKLLAGNNSDVVIGRQAMTAS